MFNYFTRLMLYAPKGQEIFTSSGTFTVPYGVTQIYVHLQGAGGGSSFYETHGSDRYSGGAGGAGGFCTLKIQVAQRQVISFVVGTGGAGHNIDTNGEAGGETSFGGYGTAYGGSGGIAYDNGAGGGTGGGVAASSYMIFSQAGANGGGGGKWVANSGGASYVSGGGLTNIGVTGSYGKGADTYVGHSGGYAGENGLICIVW